MCSGGLPAADLIAEKTISGGRVPGRGVRDGHRAAR